MAARAKEIEHPRVVRHVTARLQSQSSDNARIYGIGRAYAYPPEVLRVLRTGFRLGRAANVNVALARAAMVVVAVAAARHSDVLKRLEVMAVRVCG